MTTVPLHVLRVFLGPAGSGGNPLGVVLDGPAVAEGRRQEIAGELGFSETVFVDEVAAGVARARIFTPAVELPFAGHPTVGTSFLLARRGQPVDVIRLRAGDVATWRDGPLTWIRARPEWVHAIRMVEYATPGEVEALEPPRLGDPAFYAWAWEDPSLGILRARYFPTDIGIREDEATGAAAVVMGGRMGRPLLIRQGVGSELVVRPGPERTIEVGGRCALAEVRELTIDR